VEDDRMKKGIYFSYDALMALVVLAATLGFVTQSSEMSYGPFQSTVNSYSQSSRISQDTMRIASKQSMRYFNESYQQELLDQTVMREEDLDTSVLDGISLLWAARNYTYAERTTKYYFGSRLPDRYDYRLQVKGEDDRDYEIYSSAEIDQSDPPSAASSSAALVSGHSINKTSFGYRSRARVDSSVKNESKVVSISPLGSASSVEGQTCTIFGCFTDNGLGSFGFKKQFSVEEADEINSARFDLGFHYVTEPRFEVLRLNGQEYQPDDVTWEYDDGEVAFGTLDVTDAVQQGDNTMYFEAETDQFNAHLHPGSKLLIDYSRSGTQVRDALRHERIYLEDIRSNHTGGESGVFNVNEFDLPRNAELVNASFYLHAFGLDECNYSGFGDFNVRVIFNGNQIDRCEPQGEYTEQFDLTNQVRNGTNVVTTYINSYGNEFWGGDTTHLYSDFETDDSSHIDLWYRVNESSIRYGQIRVTASEEMGGSPENPKFYEKEFLYENVTSTNIYMAQLRSINPGVSVSTDGSNYDVVFQSEGVRSAPTKVYASPEYYDTEGGTNTVKLNDTDETYEFLPESVFQWTIWAPSQVGYGKVFENQTAAEEDAKERLREKLGPYVDATSINSDTLAIGGEPRLWGPASVKLVVWDE
jgi:hypothetical protein